jgi:hypothetical protein
MISFDSKVNNTQDMISFDSKDLRSINGSALVKKGGLALTCIAL